MKHRYDGKTKCASNRSSDASHEGYRSWRSKRAPKTMDADDVRTWVNRESNFITAPEPSMPCENIFSQCPITIAHDIKRYMESNSVNVWLVSELGSGDSRIIMYLRNFGMNIIDSDDLLSYAEQDCGYYSRSQQIVIGKPFSIIKCCSALALPTVCFYTYREQKLLFFDAIAEIKRLSLTNNFSNDHSDPQTDKRIVEIYNIAHMSTGNYLRFNKRRSEFLKRFFRIVHLRAYRLRK